MGAHDGSGPPQRSYGDHMAAQKHKGASLADVAREAGVSAQTASRVANGSDAVRETTRKRVLAAMQRLDYRPSFAARSLKAGRYKCVGLVMSGDLVAMGRRYQLEGIAAAASEHGYALTLVQLTGDDISYATAARRMLELPVDGFVIGLATIPDDFAQFEPPATLPCTILTPYAQPNCRTVDNDQTQCSEDIVERLYSTGHREIRFVAGRRESVAGIGREKAWKAALERRGLHVVEPLRGDWSADSGYEAGMRLAHDSSCDAVYAANDAMAMGVIQALRDAGRRVPEDVAVAGIDDSFKGNLPNLELTSYTFDHARVSSIAFGEVTGQADKFDQHVLVPGRLVVRHTA